MADIRVPFHTEISEKKAEHKSELSDYIDKLFLVDWCLTCRKEFLVIDAYRDCSCLYHPGYSHPITGHFSCCGAVGIPGCTYGIHAFGSLGHTPRVRVFPSDIIKSLPALDGVARSAIVRTKGDVNANPEYKTLYEGMETIIFGQPSNLQEQPLLLGSREEDMSYSFYRSSVYVRSQIVDRTHLVTDETLPVEMHVYFLSPPAQ